MSVVQLGHIADLEYPMTASNAVDIEPNSRRKCTTCSRKSVKEISIFGIDQVYQTTQASEDVIRQSIRDHVRTYPGTTVDDLSSSNRKSVLESREDAVFA